MTASKEFITDPSPGRMLDFDIENRPLAYLGHDYMTAEITAIAAGWSDEKKIYVWALGEVGGRTMLQGFRELYDQARIVTGHYIRKHDLPIINGAMLEHGLPPLSEKMTSDTKLDLVKFQQLSASQENLSEMLGIDAAKFHMNQPRWREANRLTLEGIALTKKRVTDDVRQHRELRRKLIELGALKPARMWRP